MNLLTLFYVAVFPSTLAYLCFNRRRAADRRQTEPRRSFHVVPVFGSAMAIVFLGERPASWLPHHRLCAGADRRFPLPRGNGECEVFCWELTRAWSPPVYQFQQHTPAIPVPGSIARERIPHTGAMRS